MEQRSNCRLEVSQYEATIDGSPNELRHLADLLDTQAQCVEVQLAGAATSRIRRDLTADDLLMIAVEDGPTLRISGNRDALEIVTESMRGLASGADQTRRGSVGIHEHIEHLGADDRWRAPGLHPLVIGCDWPDT